MGGKSGQVKGMCQVVSGGISLVCSGFASSHTDWNASILSDHNSDTILRTYESTGRVRGVYVGGW